MQSWQDNWQKLYKEGKWFPAFFYWADKVKDMQDIDLNSEKGWTLLEEYNLDEEVNSLIEECLSQEYQKSLNAMGITLDDRPSVMAKASKLIGKDVVDKLAENGLTIISSKELKTLRNSYLHNLMTITEIETRK